MLTFIPLSPGAHHPLRAAWNAIDPDVLRVAAAFSSESGAGELRSGIIGARQFDAADKRFLIGIQEGLRNQTRCAGCRASQPQRSGCPLVESSPGTWCKSLALISSVKGWRLRPR